MPRAKRKDTPPPPLAREAFLAKGGKEADLMQEALKRVEALPLGKRTTEELNKIAIDYGLKAITIGKNWDAICKKEEVRGGDPRAELLPRENEELIKMVYESYANSTWLNPPIEGLELRELVAEILAKRNIILPYINGTPNQNWLDRWRRKNRFALRGYEEDTPCFKRSDPLFAPRKRKASSQSAKKKTKKSKANKSSQNEDQSNPASDETLVNSSEGEYSDIGSDIKSSEDEEEDDEGEDEEDEEEDDVELDNPDNGRYMKFINLEDGESEYVRHPNCRLTKKGAIKFGIPPWLLHLYE